MRFLLALAAICCFLGNSYSAEAEVAKAENTTCCCGKPADASKTVSVTADGHAHTYAVCSDECMKAVKAMKSEEAVKAFSSANKNAPAK